MYRGTDTGLQNIKLEMDTLDVKVNMGFAVQKLMIFLYVY